VNITRFGQQKETAKIEFFAVIIFCAQNLIIACHLLEWWYNVHGRICKSIFLILGIPASVCDKM
jgi:hypothetical protein